MANKENFGRDAAVVLAAGRGSRMKSDLPKVLHEIDGEPMLVKPLRMLTSLKFGQIVTVVNHGAELVAPVAEPYSTIARQGEAYGTAKAVEAAIPVLNPDVENVLVVNGDDSMFYEAKTFKDVLSKHKREHNKVTIVTVLKQDPTGFGRIVYDAHGDFEKIVEEKDATVKERHVKEVNTGFYVFDREFLQTNLPNVVPSEVTQEYYLPAVINMALEEDKKVGTHLLEDALQFFGVSTQADVARANELYSEVKNV